MISVMKIQIKCKYDELVKLSDFKAHPKNPNEHSVEQIKRLAKLYEYHGVRHPIIVSKLSGYIVAGHGRLLAAKELGMATMPATFQDFDSEESEYAFLVSDNAIATWAEISLSLVNSELPNLGPEFDIDWLGLKKFSVDLPQIEEIGDKGDPNHRDDNELKTCPNCGVLIV